MKDRRHTFATDAVEVTWSKARCIHAAECVRRLGRVFQPGERPWIQLEHAGADEVARTIERCPTGALQYTRRDGAPNEAPPATNTVLVSRDGPTYLRGRIEVGTPEGELLLADSRVAICRCGHSRNRPFCDGSHEI